MIQATKKFFYDWKQLLYWLFFRPWKLRDLPKEFLLVNQESSFNQTVTPYSAKSWRFLLQAFFITIGLTWALDILIGLLVTFLGGYFKWDSILAIAAIAATGSFVTGIFARGELNDLNLCVRGGIVSGSLISLAASHKVGFYVGLLIALASAILAWAEFSIQVYFRDTKVTNTRERLVGSIAVGFGIAISAFSSIGIAMIISLPAANRHFSSI